MERQNSNEEINGTGRIRKEKKIPKEKKNPKRELNWMKGRTNEKTKNVMGKNIALEH